MNKTENYGLNIPSKDDNFDIDHFNENSKIIDKALDDIIKIAREPVDVELIKSEITAIITNTFNDEFMNNLKGPPGEVDVSMVRNLVLEYMNTSQETIIQQLFNSEIVVQEIKSIIFSPQRTISNERVHELLDSYIPYQGGN